MGKLIRRNLFLILAALLAAALIVLAGIGNSFLTIAPTSIMAEGQLDEPPFPSCFSAPFYSADGAAQDGSRPYRGPAPVYRLPPELLGAAPPDCIFPETVTPTLVTSAGVGFFPIHLAVETPAAWMRLGESTTLAASVEIANNFIGVEALNQEAIHWSPDETRQVSFSMSAPNFEFSPANDEIQPQPLGRGRPARQIWIIAPRGSVAGDQVISVKIEDPATQLPVTFAYLWLNVRHPTGLDPVFIALVAVVGLAVGWVLDRIKTIAEIRRMTGGGKPPAEGGGSSSR